MSSGVTSAGLEFIAFAGLTFAGLEFIAGLYSLTANACLSLMHAPDEMMMDAMMKVCPVGLSAPAP